jgi:hypothetical protein
MIKHYELCSFRSNSHLLPVTLPLVTVIHIATVRWLLALNHLHLRQLVLQIALQQLQQSISRFITYIEFLLKPICYQVRVIACTHLNPYRFVLGHLDVNIKNLRWVILSHPDDLPLLNGLDFWLLLVPNPWTCLSTFKWEGLDLGESFLCETILSQFGFAHRLQIIVPDLLLMLRSFHSVNGLLEPFRGWRSVRLSRRVDDRLERALLKW